MSDMTFNEALPYSNIFSATQSDDPNHFKTLDYSGYGAVLHTIRVVGRIVIHLFVAERDLL